MSVKCVGELEIMYLKYVVVEVDSGAKVLKIKRSGIPEHLCFSTFVNTTIVAPFQLYRDDYPYLSLFYGCPPLVGGFACTIEGMPSNGIYYNINGSAPLEYNRTSECKEMISMPVLNDVVVARMSNLMEFPTNIALLEEVIDGGFHVKYDESYSECQACINDDKVCVYNTGALVCRGKEGSSNITVWVIVGSGVVGLCVVLVTLFLIIRRRRKLPFYSVFYGKLSKQSQKVQEFLSKCGSLALKRYSYKDVKKMTNSFENKLGQGGFGGVFKGKLPNGRLVAVKLMKESNGDGEDFINEVTSISRTSHVNVVSLLGFCFDGFKRALVYEFMPNGSLEKFIYKDRQFGPGLNLPWEKLYAIIVGVARGLEYLHRGCNTRIVHFDIKPHNILLDKDFCPKISDFGLAKLCVTKDSIISMLGTRGTPGYIAPEVFCRTLGGISHKSDVYSYGMMVLEISGGKFNMKTEVTSASEIFFPHWIHNRLELGADLGQPGITIETDTVVRKMLIVGLLCIQTNPVDRPSMSKVVEMLEGSLELLQIPPNTFLASPSRSEPEQERIEESSFLCD